MITRNRQTYAEQATTVQPLAITGVTPDDVTAPAH
jgi:hypothetical protein